jgi:alpha-N-arabinofuranosidase
LQAPVFKTGDVELPAVQVSAARAADGKLVLALVNLHPERPARVATNLTSTVTGHVLTGGAMDAHNTFQRPQAVMPAPFSARPGPQGLVLELPAKSVVVVGM